MARPPRRRPSVQLAAVHRALDEHCTDAVRLQVVRYVAYRLALMQPASPVSKKHVAELVHDALASIRSGAQTWDPKRTPLAVRLCSLIDARLSGGPDLPLGETPRRWRSRRR